MDAFKEHLPNEPRWPHEGEKLISKDRRIYVSTYPSMTPTDIIDHNTFKLFNCDNGLPTFAYTYEEAVTNIPLYLCNCTVGDQVKLQRGKDITKASARNGSIPVISSGGISVYHDETFVEGPGVLLGRKGSMVL